MRVLVLGAGPAGASCAIQLLKAGIEVVVLDKQGFPRPAPGETLHPGIEPLLEALGVMEEIRKYQFVRHKGVVHQSSQASTLDFYNQDQNWEGYQFFREAFDKILLDRAIACGAEFQSGVVLKSVESNRNGIASLATNLGSFKADFFIDATGRSAALSRKLGIGYQVKSIPLFVHYGYVQTDGSAMFGNPQIAWDTTGWTWISQITEKLISWNRLSPYSPKIPKGWLPVQIENLNSAGPPKAADVTWRIADKVSAENYFLLGDAAFVLDPISSKGVLKAIMSGMMCGHLLGHLTLEKSDVNEMHCFYNRWINRWFANDFRKMKDIYVEKGISISPCGNKAGSDRLSTNSMSYKL